MSTSEPGRAAPQTAQPRVSVVIPTFNSSATISEALRSVAAQGYDNLEVLVIDDGSTDATVPLVRERHPWASVHQQANSGAAAARNRGLREASGDLIAFLDADDVWFEGKLRAQTAALQRDAGLGFAYTEWLVAEAAPDWSSAEAIAMQRDWPAEDATDAALSGWLYSALLFDVVIHTSTLVLRRELAQQTGFFNESLRRGQDYDYWLRMSRLARGVKLKRPFSLYRQHADNAIRKPQPRNYAHEILCGALRQWGTSGPDGSTIDPARLRAALSRSCRDFAYLHAHSGSASLSIRHAARAVAHDPGNPGNLWLAMKIAARAAARAAADSFQRHPRQTTT